MMMFFHTGERLKLEGETENTAHFRETGTGISEARKRLPIFLNIC